MYNTLSTMMPTLVSIQKSIIFPHHLHPSYPYIHLLCSVQISIFFFLQHFDQIKCYMMGMLHIFSLCFVEYSFPKAGVLYWLVYKCLEQCLTHNGCSKLFGPHWTPLVLQWLKLWASNA